MAAAAAAASGGAPVGDGFIVDADAHIEVTPQDLLPYVDPPWSLYLRRSEAVFLADVGDPSVAGRIKRPAGDYDGIVGAAARVVLPGPLLTAGLHPSRPFAAVVARAYARWVAERYLPEHPADRALLPLPIEDVDACREIVAACEHPRVAGVFVSGVAFPQMVENRYVDLYADLQERGLVLGFHPHPVWREPPYEIFDRYLPVWALGYPFTQTALLVNWLVHGMPERFPALRCAFYEAGVSWLTFAAHRFDQEFLKRRIEAPLLRERPSHYMRRFFFGTQPLDQVDDPAWLEAPVRAVGPSQLMYASAHPQWDFDTPEVVRRLPFLSDAERAGILGGNAARCFGVAAAAAGARSGEGAVG